MPLSERPPLAQWVDASFSKDGAGKLLGLLVSHHETSTQTLTLWDNPTPGSNTLLVLNIAPEQCPFYVMFPRDMYVLFQDGLSATLGNCDLIVWVQMMS
ncbi:MAG: hypothetical protein ACUVWZ_13825 [Anaerolineae bacterium]